jgi:phosphonoacetaldehyde hydrolase
MEVFARRSYRGKLRAVILDWAGTTIDFGSCAPLQAFDRLFKQYCVPITAEDARTPMGLDKREHIRKLLQIQSIADRWLLHYNHSPSEDEIETMYAQLIPILKEVILKNAELIPGTIEANAAFRNRSLRIGSTSGYNREIMNMIIPLAKQRGFEPDATVCVTDVPSGRPDPWMALKCAMNMSVYPMTSIVKVGDTLSDIAEGLNAGMWTVGIAKTGNELGLSLAEIAETSPQLIEQRLKDIYLRMYRAGAHYVVDGIVDVIPVLDDIDRRLSCGESP